jgi:exodeoxyribonuclease VII small subunit
MAESKSASFEEALKQLDQIVKELEGENIDLERSVALFKQGRTLVAHCEALLKTAEETLKGSDGDVAAGRSEEPAPEDETPF